MTPKIVLKFVALVVSTTTSIVAFVTPARAVATFVLERLPDRAPEDEVNVAPTPAAIDVPVTLVQVRLRAVPVLVSTSEDTAPLEGDVIL